MITLSETWLHNNISDQEIIIQNFSNPYRKDRNQDAHGGVAIYVRSNINSKQRKDLEIEELEATWCELLLGQKKILVGVFYRPPNANIEYWKKVEDSIELAKVSDIPYIFLLGDLNCNLLIPKTSLSEILDNYNLTQLIREPTHFTKNSQTLIDIIASGSLDLVKHALVRGPSLSNHCDVELCLKFNGPKVKPITRKITDYKHANWKDLKKEIKKHDWEMELTGDIDEQVEKWTESYTRIIKKHIPQRIITEPEWLTTEIKHLQRERKRKHDKAKRTNKELDWLNFRNIRTEVQEKIRTTKAEITEKLSATINTSYKQDDKLWWKITKNIYKNGSNSSALNPPLLINGKQTESNLEKANAFNNFFTQASTLELRGDEETPDTDVEATINIIRVPAETVKEILKTLKPNKACGPDNITPRVLRETAEEISPSIARLYNFSLASGTFPYIWKIANITALHNKDDKQNVQNYRPISLLSTVGKCLERCVQKTVQAHLIDQGHISPTQAAYTPKSSTVTQLLEMYHTITEAMDKGKEIRFLFMDVSKAFDQVWHQGILYKLKKAGIGGTLLTWFENYLKDRKQCVVVEGVSSELVDHSRSSTRLNTRTYFIHSLHQ